MGFRKQGKVGIGREKDFSPFHKTKVGIDQAKIGDSAANLWVWDGVRHGKTIWFGCHLATDLPCERFSKKKKWFYEFNTTSKIKKKRYWILAFEIEYIESGSFAGYWTISARYLCVVIIKTWQPPLLESLMGIQVISWRILSQPRHTKKWIMKPPSL